jgi:hypothetical protein
MKAGFWKHCVFLNAWWFATPRSGDEPKLSLFKNIQNFKLKTFTISNKPLVTTFFETAFIGCILKFLL